MEILYNALQQGGTALESMLIMSKRLERLGKGIGGAATARA